MKIKLIQYKGGGYDGCNWEWNYCLLIDNKFIDVGSSGRNGIKDKATLLKRYRNKRDHSWGGQEFYIYDLSDATARDEFVSETNENDKGPVCAVVNEALKKHRYDIRLSFECSYCDEDISPVKSEHENYPQFFHDEQNYCGNGGVGINWGSTICESCYLNRCAGCDVIISGPDDESHYDEEEGQAYCEHCHEERTKNTEEQKS